MHLGKVKEQASYLSRASGKCQCLSDTQSPPRSCSLNAQTTLKEPICDDSPVSVTSLPPPGSALSPLKEPWSFSRSAPRCPLVAVSCALTRGARCPDSQPGSRNGTRGLCPRNKHFVLTAHEDSFEARLMTHSGPVTGGSEISIHIVRGRKRHSPSGPSDEKKVGLGLWRPW